MSEFDAEFEAIAYLTNDEMRHLLFATGNSVLVMICRFCSKRVIDKIYSNLSKRAITLLEEDIAMKKNAPISKFEAAKEIMVLTLRFLRSEGIIK
jgi:flagellar motor switch protein FliG